MAINKDAWNKENKNVVILLMFQVQKAFFGYGGGGTGETDEQEAGEAGEEGGDLIPAQNSGQRQARKLFRKDKL